MSAGPIKAERDAWKPPAVSTTSKARICLTASTGRGWCGRRNTRLATDLQTTTCADCHAAARADGITPEDTTIKEPR